jgi:YD repeat-containing protein
MDKSSKTKNKGQIFLVLFLMLGVGFSMTAQSGAYYKETVSKIIPPSPTAFQFSTYGDLPLNGSSGGFSYTVPIYTVQSGDISLPLSLDYYSAGVQVDGLSGMVGTDWNLNAGGVISRVVKDFPDELANRWYPSTIDPSTQGVMLKNIARESGFDGEQDWFSFNVNGISGSFYFDESLVPHILSNNENITIAYEQLSSNFLKFTITDDKGYKYIFGGSDSYIEKNISLDECSSYSYNYNSAWFLQQIISPTNNSITFAYTDNNLAYKTNLSKQLVFSQICGSGSSLVFSQSVNECLNTSSIQSRAISAINFKNYSVAFDYNSTRTDGGGKSLMDIKILRGTNLIKQVNVNYEMVTNRTVPISTVLSGDNTLLYRMFLKEIIFQGNLPVANQEKYSFDYYSKEQLPLRLSYSKDKYGFNNGSTNAKAFSNELMTSAVWPYIQPCCASEPTADLEVHPSYIYYGMLQKITFPTGGYTLVNYEANSDTKLSDTVVPLTGSINLNNPCNASGTALSGSFTFTGNGTPINFTAHTGPNQSPACTIGALTDKYNITITKDGVAILNVDTTNGIDLSSNSAVGCVNSVSGSYGLQPICTTTGSSYKITFTLKKSGTTGALNYSYNADYVTQTVYGSGVRVKDISDYTDGQSYNKRNFFYNKLANYPSNDTSMNNTYDPKFYSPFGNFLQDCNSGGLYLDYSNQRFNVYSNSINSSYLVRRSTYYSAITEINENNGLKNGAKERIYVLNSDSPGQLLFGIDVYGSPSSNYGDFFKDKVAEETIYDSQNLPKNKKTYHYTLLSSNYLTSTIARRNYPIPGEDDFVTNAEIPSIPAPFSNYSVYLYKNYYGVIKTDTITEIDYYGANFLKKITANVYNGQPLFQLKSSSTANSLGETVKTEYKYPPDLIGVEQTPYMQQLKDANRIGEPVITKTYNGSTKLTEKHIKFFNSSATGSLLLPIEQHFRKGTTDINIATTTDRKLQLTKYDTYGNIQEYKQENGVPVSIIWGYNSSVPVAKLENMAYATIPSTLISAIQNATDSTVLSDSSISSALDALRSSTTLAAAMITTYSYVPLVGPASITDPKGDKIFYTYDAAGRLIMTKDKENKIISENVYHFKS